MIPNTSSYKLLGGQATLDHKKKGFFSSRIVTPGPILRIYEWATEQKNSGACVISGFHSKIEKDVLHILLQGDQPLIIVLARGMYRKWDSRIKARIKAGNMLVISPFPDSITKVTPHSCAIRNKLIIELADSIVVGYCDPKGTLAKLFKGVNKPIEYLDSQPNNCANNVHRTHSKIK